MRERHPDELLSAFLDDELDDTRALEVARHVAVCQSCGQELDALRQAREALRTLPGLIPPDEMFRAVPNVAAEHGSRTVRRRVAAGAGGALVGLVAVAFLLGGEEPGEVVPPVEMVVVDHVVRTGGGPVLQPVVLDR